MNRIQSIRACLARFTAVPLSRHLAHATIAISSLLVCAAPAHAQAVYPTPEAAADAFADALAINDHAAMQHVLGQHYDRFIPSKDVGDEDIYEFLGAWAAGHRIVDDAAPLHGRPSKHLSVGTGGWTLPIPLVQASSGWRFDPAAGSDEILTRRIGRNERAAIMTSLAYLDAQRDYSRIGRPLRAAPPQHAGSTRRPLLAHRSRRGGKSARSTRSRDAEHRIGQQGGLSRLSLSHSERAGFGTRRAARSTMRRTAR